MSFQGIATVSTSVNLTALPTIEEQATITKQDECKHKSIAEVFPDQPQKEATQQQQQQQPERRGSERRKRNTSESNASAKFQVGGRPRVWGLENIERNKRLRQN